VDARHVVILTSLFSNQDLRRHPFESFETKIVAHYAYSLHRLLVLWNILPKHTLLKLEALLRQMANYY
jgi:hypothetical protein